MVDLDDVIVAVFPASFSIEFDAGVEPLAVDVDGLRERVGLGVVATLADEAREHGVHLLDVDDALDAVRVVAERAHEGRLQLRLLLRPRQQLGHPRLALSHRFRPELACAAKSGCGGRAGLDREQG
jgi:hypothetical protein